MSYLLEDMEKWAEDRDAKADLNYLDQLYEETQAAQRKYNQGLKRAKRMGNTGLATGLGGIGLTLASIQGKPSKLKAKGTMAGAGLIMGSLVPLVGSEVVKYKAIRGAQNHIDSLRNNKELQAIEREYQRAQAEQEKVAMPAFNDEATRSRNFLPGVSEALEKVKEAEATKNKVLKSYNEAQPAINVLKQRFEKNQERLNRAESQEWARARLRSSGRSLNRLIKNRPVPIGPMSEAMEEDWDSTGARKNVKYWGQEYKKSLEKNPNDIKYKNHYEKQMDLSERLLERAKRKAPLTKDMISATNERSDAGKQYRLTRGAYNTKREQNLPAVPTPPKDIFLEGLQLDLKQKMRDLGQKTRKDIDQIHQEILDDFSKSRVERKQKTEQAMKTPFSRNKALGLGVGLAGTTAALGGGAYLYNRYKKKKRAQAEQEKTAAPMFGKGRYIPRSEVDDRHRAYDRLVEHERKKDNHDPSYNRKSHREDEEAYDKANQAYDDMIKRNKQTTAFRRKHITLPAVVSAMIASDALKEKALGDRSDAKAFGLAAGLVGAYPAFQGARIGIKELKNRYHWSKQENIDKDRAEREKDQDVYDRAYKPWFAPRGNERLGK